MAVSKIKLSLKEESVIELMKYQSIENDLYVCERFLTLLSELKELESSGDKMDREKLLIQSLTLSFIVTYMKMFSTGSRNTWTPSTVYIHDKEMIAMHETIYLFRKHYVAHAVNFKGELLEIHSIFKTHDDAEGGRWNHRIEPSVRRMYSFKKDEFPLLVKMMKMLREYWVSKSEDPTLKIAYENVSKHLKELEHVLDPAKQAEILQEFDHRTFQVKMGKTL